VGVRSSDALLGRYWWPCNPRVMQQNVLICVHLAID
jgi:hypothetical protein